MGWRLRCQSACFVGARPRRRLRQPQVPPLAPIKEVVRRTVERPEQQAHLVLGWQAPILAESDSLALDLVATILAGNESSRMVRALRDGERIITRVTLNNSTLQLTSIIYDH